MWESKKHGDCLESRMQRGLPRPAQAPLGIVILMNIWVKQQLGAYLAMYAR